MTYIPGDHWVIDQKTGFKVRSSELAQEPTKDNPYSGNWVWKAALDPVHPQEYVTGVEDDPSVSLVYAPAEQVVGETTLLANITADTKKAFPVNKTVAANDPIGIVMDNGACFWSFAYSVEDLEWTPWIDADGYILYDVNGVMLTTADAFDGYLVTLASYIHDDASLGNTVYLPALNNEVFQ